MLRRQWRKGAPQRLCGHRAQPHPAEASWHPSTTLGYLRVGSSRQLSLCPVINLRQGEDQGWRESDTGKWTMWGKRKESGVISGGRIHTCGHEPGWHRYLRSVRGSRGEKGDEGRQRKVCQELDLKKKKKMQRQRRNLKRGQIQRRTGSVSSFSLFSVCWRQCSARSCHDHPLTPTPQ